MKMQGMTVLSDNAGEEELQAYNRRCVCVCARASLKAQAGPVS
jgi:hypothetical protein